MSATLLIVDDSPAIHELVKASLADDGYNLLHTGDGASALAIAAQVKPALILLDVGLPDLSGFDICKRLKANPATHRIGVVFLTASQSADDLVRGMELSPEDYIVKPFDSRELSLRLRWALRSLHVSNLIEDADSTDGEVSRTAGGRGIPKLQLGQIIQARSKNPWGRVPPAQPIENAPME